MSERQQARILLESIPEQNLHEIVFQTEVKIKEYKDFLDRVDYLGQEQWARHIPQEEIRPAPAQAMQTMPKGAGRTLRALPSSPRRLRMHGNGY